MSSVRLRWDGLEEFRQQLRKLPQDLAEEASGVVLSEAAEAMNEILDGYPEITGNLKRGLRLKKAAAGPYGAGVLLRNSAKHAWLYDHGSQARHYVTSTGKAHATGAMWGNTSPKHVFVRAVVKHKAQMVERLKGVVRKAGFVVTGEA